MKKVERSLTGLLGKPYMDAVTGAAAVLLGMDSGQARKLAEEKVDFLPQEWLRRMDAMLDRVGEQICPPVADTVQGAPTNAFAKAANSQASPVSGFGYYRLGEDGRLYLASKSEHYHTPMGHNFPGYRLIDNARALGVTNATHNNTRGYITRLCERELVRCANGLARGDVQGLEKVLASTERHVLNRVINLETGSLACEAGIKMMLARFYRLDKTFPAPKYSGKIPVFFVMQDYDGGAMANYHGTTVLAQTFRDMWPELYAGAEAGRLYEVCPIAINNIEDFKEKFARYNTGNYKAAGLIHEIILMNYGGIKLHEDYLQEVYRICHEGDTPILCDEIQSCMWYEGMFLFRLYGLNPDFVAIGKGFPGGQYPASRILLSAEMDNLNQFGALVTNGQEELASLAYLITMEYAQENAEEIRDICAYYEEQAETLKARFPSVVERIEGQGLLSAVTFRDVGETVRFVQLLQEECIDVSAQVYKACCPPAALLKLPLIASRTMVDWMIQRMAGVLTRMKAEAGG